MKKLSQTVVIRLGKGMARVDPPLPADPPPAPAPQPPAPGDDPARAAQYAADLARAEADKLKKQLDELKSQMPSEEQRARWAQMENEAQKAEEDRLAKAGQFDQWRAQINDKHQKEIAEREQAIANSRAVADSIEKELNDKLIGLEFAGAVTWFGPNGKTVLLPDIAQSYFAKNVHVEVERDTHGNVVSRKVVVKDNRGTVIVDPRTGKPAEFADAIGELIQSHPNKNQMLRGSGKVGSGSAGGGNGIDSIDLAKLRPSDFQNPEIRERVRQAQNVAGGLQIGPAFDRAAAAKRKS
jgi:hypothetical protein